MDPNSVAARLLISAGIAVIAFVAGGLAGRLLARRHPDDPYGSYYARKIGRYGAGLITLIALAVVWRTFAGRLSVVFGLLAAGLAFAMQEVIGALAGWFNILSGRIFRVGDRIQMGGVRGDVIDITPLRTKVMEMGSSLDEEMWVKGRQYTGRIVAISNKSTFTEPVYNFSAAFEYLWDELTFTIPYEQDWQLAETILKEEAKAASTSEGARDAIRDAVRYFPVGRTEVEPRVFVNAGDNGMELSARFVVPLRSARSVKDAMTRKVIERFTEAGLSTAFATSDVRVHGTVQDASVEEGSNS
jgi:small-conductance mechanosensitive channel